MEVPIIDISSYRPILGENFTDDCHNINNSDLNPLLSERKQAIIHQIVESFSSLGFIYIIGHGVSIELLELVSQQNQLFYSLSLEEKLSFMSKDKARRGYSSINTENFASLAGEVKPNDLVEKLRFGPEISSEILENDSYYHSNECKVHFMPNEWGNLSTTFRDVVLEYYNSMQRLAVLILEMLALGLGQSADYFTSSMDKHTSILTFNHFPSVSQLELPVEPNQLRVAEHTDVSLITIVNQLQPNSCPTSSSVGLEICTPDGQWIPIPNIPGETSLFFFSSTYSPS